MPSGRRLQWLLLATIYAFALALRLWFWKIPAYGDEGAFYYTARHLTAAAPNVHDLYVPDSSNLAAHAFYRPDPPVFWYRPAHFLALWSGAQFGFDAFRLWSILLASALPSLAAALLLANGIRWVAAAAAGLTLAATPFMVVWSVITTPDALMTTWFVAGLLAWTLRRNFLVGAFFLAAAWTKEIAALGMVVVLTASIATRIRTGEAVLWPLRLSRRETTLGIAIALAPLGLLTALSKGGYAPTGSGHAGMGTVLGGVFLTLWLGLPILLGLRSTSSRWLCLVALAYPAFYVLYELLGRFTNLWYFVLPATLSVIGTAAAIDAWHRHLSTSGRAQRTWPLGAAGLALLLILMSVLAPGGALKEAILQPLGGRGQDNLLQAHAYESNRDADRDAAWAAIDLSPRSRVFLIDVYGADMLYPVAESGAFVLQGETDTVEIFQQTITPWPEALENRTDFTILKEQKTPLNQAVRETYGECARLHMGAYWVIDASGCRGRGAALEQRYRELRQA